MRSRSGYDAAAMTQAEHNGFERHERFGRYLLLRRIAVGGMADIYLAHDPLGEGSEEFVVIKRLRADKQDDPRQSSAMEDEAKVLRRLRHPNIVRALETGTLEGRDFLALEFVWGESLATLSQLCHERRRYIPAEASIFICAQVAAALHHAHRQLEPSGEPSPIIHRDVTLSNVMVTYDGEVKVLDYGIALASDRLARTQSGMVKGTLVYLAPEQVLGDEVSPQTDIYQLGVLLYKLLVGHEPFEQTDLEPVLMAIVRGEIVDPAVRVPSFPASVRAVLNRALARAPGLRHASAGELEAALRALLGGGDGGGKARLTRWITDVAGDRYERQQRYLGRLRAGMKIEQGTEIDIGRPRDHAEPSLIYVEYSEMFSKHASFDEQPVTQPEDSRSSVRVNLDDVHVQAPQTRAAMDDEAEAPLGPRESTERNAEPTTGASWRDQLDADYFGSDTEIQTNAPAQMLEEVVRDAREAEVTVRLDVPPQSAEEPRAEDVTSVEPAAPELAADLRAREEPASDTFTEKPSPPPGRVRPASLFEPTEQVEIPPEGDFHDRSTLDHPALEDEGFDINDTLILGDDDS